MNVITIFSRTIIALAVLSLSGCGSGLSEEDEIIKIMNQESVNEEWTLNGSIEGNSVSWMHGHSQATSVGYDLKRTIKSKPTARLIDMHAPGPLSPVSILAESDGKIYHIRVESKTVSVRYSDAQSAEEAVK